MFKVVDQVETRRDEQELIIEAAVSLRAVHTGSPMVLFHSAVPHDSVCWDCAGWSSRGSFSRREWV